MKERPIIFSAPMVRAILAGTKSQTRRAIKRIPWRAGVNVLFSQARAFVNGGDWRIAGSEEMTAGFRCPYGKPGHRLWVRETWGISDHGFDTFEESASVVYRADSARPEPRRWRSPIHMPRASSRILLEVTDVRVERLQDISAEDCAAEGVSVPVDARTKQVLIDISTKNGPAKFLKKEHFDGPQSREWFADVIRAHYAALWESINGADSWAANPWVWAISFKRIGATA